MNRPSQAEREAAPVDLPMTAKLARPTARWALLSPEIGEYNEHQNMLGGESARALAPVLESER